MDPLLLENVNGTYNSKISDKQLIIQRIKQQKSAIKKLEESIEYATKNKIAFRDKLRHIVRDSDKFMSILRAKAELNEKELKTFLVPTIRRSTYDNESSSSLTSVRQGYDSASLRPKCLLPMKRSHGVTEADTPSNLFDNNQTASTFSDFSTSGKRQQTKLTSAIPTVGGTASGLNRRLPAPHSLEVNSNPDKPVDDMFQTPIDFSVELIFSRIKRSLQSADMRVTANQTELQRFKFTQDSQNGKRIMNRIRVLQTENEELSRQSKCGRSAKVNSLIALRQNFLARIKRSNQTVEMLAEEAESETEVFTSTLLLLQQQLNLARTTIEVLAVALEAVNPGRCLEIFSGTNWPLPDSLSHLVSFPSPSQDSSDVTQGDVRELTSEPIFNASEVLEVDDVPCSSPPHVIPLSAIVEMELNGSSSSELNQPENDTTIPTSSHSSAVTFGKETPSTPYSVDSSAAFSSTLAPPGETVCVSASSTECVPVIQPSNIVASAVEENISRLPGVSPIVSTTLPNCRDPRILRHRM